MSQGWQNCLGGVRGTKSESLFQPLCYQNQMDNVCPEKSELSSMSQKSGVRDQGGAQSQFQEISPLLRKKKQQSRLQKHFPGGGKNLAPCYPGVAGATPCHPVPPHGYGPDI